MDALALARWQFALTTIFHFFFVPLTLGLSIFTALLQTQYVRTGDEKFKKMTKFWGTIFLINFAIGVVTGIVQEFQFGLNWSEYSRFMGDIFGAPLAIEALLAFYMESTFIGVWVFGWDKLPKQVHLASIWLTAIGSNISALWILIANSFMQHPMGYTLDPQTGRALMENFGALITNPNVGYQFTHVFTAGMSMAGFVVMAFSAWQLLRKNETAFFKTSLQWGAMYALIGSLLVATIGHFQGQFLVQEQPMKMAAAEALWETEAPASFSIVAGIDEQNQTNTFDLKVPGVLSFLSYNNFTGEVKGLKDLQAEAVAKYGEGNYVPPVALNFWSFRLMVAAGSLMVLLAGLAVWWGKDIESKTWLLKTLIPSAALPYLAATTGWILAETGRWPWIVYGLQKVEQAVSPNVPAWNIVLSLVLFVGLYTVLGIIAFNLAVKAGTGSTKEAAHQGAAAD